MHGLVHGIGRIIPHYILIKCRQRCLNQGCVFGSVYLIFILGFVGAR